MSLLQIVMGPEYEEEGRIKRDVGFGLPEGCPQGARPMFTQSLNGHGICVNVGP